MSPPRIRLIHQILRGEGPRAVRDRIDDRWQEFIRRRQLEPLDGRESGLLHDAPPAPVLNVSPFAPAPKRGGSQIQLFERLAEERFQRTVALVYPRDGLWWLEVYAGQRGGIQSLGNRDRALESVTTAMGLVKTETVHIENPHGLHPDLTVGLIEPGFETILSIHDFTPFCLRPQLIEPSTGVFCDYSRDDERCKKCLRDIAPKGWSGQTAYRRLGSMMMREARSIVFPSAFLRRTYRDLFPDRRPDQSESVIAPTSTSRSEGSFDPDLSRVAFVGGAYRHKGAALIPAIMTSLRTALPDVSGVVYGTGDRGLLSLLRSERGLRVRGYYRQGQLSQLLRRDRIAVAILPSIWPETYALVVDECISAGVPVVAFDLGAVGERLRSWGLSESLATERSAQSLAQAALISLTNRSEMPDLAPIRLPSPVDAALAHIELYQSSAPGRR